MFSCRIFPGKSLFLYYVLLRRLESGLPTAFQLTEEEFILFDNEGFRVLSSRIKFPPDTLGLVDSNAVIESPAPAFQSGTIRIIQATSPKARQWKPWAKEYNAGFVVMRSWDKDEMEKLS